MSMTTSIIAERLSIHVNLSGEYSLEEAQSSFLEIIGAVKENKLGSVLIDGRQMTGQPRLLDRFFYGHFVAEAVQDLTNRGWDGPELRFAYVLEGPMIDRSRLGETTAISRGMNVRVFDNINEAVVWLLPKSQNIEDPAVRVRQIQVLKPEH